jgi:hypothetical protein
MSFWARRALVPLALLSIFILAAGFHQPPTASPPVDPIDRPLYNKGSACYRAVVAQLNALQQTSTLAGYEQAATRLRNKAAACVTKIQNATPASDAGNCAQTVLAKAFAQYRDAGKLFQQAADASAAGNTSGASAKTAKAGNKVNAAGKNLTKADGILRHTRAC